MAKLYFYYSSMNAGKSTALLQSSYNYRERGMNTLILAPLLCSAFAASAQEGDIVRDGEYRFLEAQQGEAWAEQDARVEARLAEIRDALKQS